MALTPKIVLDEIDRIHKSKPNYGHPLWAGMLDDSLTIEQIRYFCRQHGSIPLHNHNYHGRLYVICPDPEWREEIASVAYEEATGRLFANGVSHHKLYLDYGAAIGISKDEMYATKFCAGVVAFQAYFSYICGKTFLEGVASHMLGGEAPIPGTYGRIAKRLQDRFGLDDRGVAYWVVHDTADEDHSGVGVKLLDRFATTQDDFQLVIDTVQTTVDVMHLMYDDIWGHMRNIEAAGEAAQ
jgi:pyrroloquinoline quinone (PQQ) biosynthesis protein C